MALQANVSLQGFSVSASPWVKENGRNEQRMGALCIIIQS